MQKHQMREFLSELEDRIDKSLAKWKKTSRIENGEVVQIEWQFEQCRIILDLFWLDGDEGVHLICLSPRMGWNNKWSGLNDETARKLMDRAGNFAQIMMDPNRK